MNTVEPQVSDIAPLTIQSTENQLYREQVWHVYYFEENLFAYNFKLQNAALCFRSYLPL